MEAKRFDAITKDLISTTHRRRTLGRVLLGALGAPGLARPRAAEAAKSGTCTQDCDPLCEFCKVGKCRKKKSGKKVCKPGKCTPLTDGTPCSAANGAICQTGVCACPGGTTVCSGVCKDLQTDNANCGTCGTACPANQDCLNGGCGCAAGLQLCGGVCFFPCASSLQLRESDHCECCFVGGSPVCLVAGGNPTPSPLCCSLMCSPIGGGPGGTCARGANGTPCIVDAHCDSGNCHEDNLCAP